MTFPSTFEDDFRWQECFRGHFSEIARLASRVDVAAPEDDWERNTDFVLTLRQNRLTFSARARRFQYAERYVNNFSIRLGRATGAKTEMAKMLNGHGDMLIYGFESAPGSDRLCPWLLGNLEILRQYIRDGGYYEPKPNDDGTTAAYFYLDDMPLGFLENSEGIPPVDREDPWQRCRNPKCGGRWTPEFRGDGRFVQPLDEAMQPGDGYWRECLYCGNKWRSGWIMPATRSSGPVSRDRNPPRLTG
jgi:hypothetical protein